MLLVLSVVGAASCLGSRIQTGLRLPHFNLQLLLRTIPDHVMRSGLDCLLAPSPAESVVAGCFKRQGLPFSCVQPK